MLKKLFSHTAIYGLAPQVIRLAQLFVLPIITPFLTSTDYGVFGLIGAVVGSVSVFASLGLSIVLSNSFTKSPNQFKWLWRQIYGFLSVWSIFYALIVSCILYVFIPKEAVDNALIIIILNIGPIVLFGPTGLLGSLYYQLNQKPTQIAIRSILVGLLTLTLNIYFIKYLKMGYMGWFWANAIAQSIESLSYFIPLNFKLGISPIFNFKRKTIKKQVLICLPTIPHYYSGYFIGAFDKILMKFFGVSTSSIGKYNMAAIPSGVFGAGVGALNQAISPILLQTYKANDRLTEQRLNFVSSIVVLLGTCIGSLFIKDLLPIVLKTGDGLEDLYVIAVVLIMAAAHRPMYVAANNRLFYVEKTKALIKVTTIAAFISVILNVLTIYFFGYKAAAFTAFICSMYIGYSGFFIKEFKESKGTNHYPIFWLCLTVALTGAMITLYDASFYIRLIVGVVLVVIAAFGFLFVNKKFRM